MLLALPRGRPTALARRLNAPLPLRNLGSTSTTGSSHSFDPHDVPPAMAAPPSTEETPAQEGAKLRSRPAVQLKTPKGTRDLFGPSLLLREQIFQTMTDVFKRHGGMPLDTPVFELREILAGKYGEDSKLIYDLQDQGGEVCSLRYDLTVPFARWLAMNTNFQQVKRYHIAKVYRRDQPAIARGRYREFYQCDFDIAGQYDAMIPDGEILALVVEVLEALKLDITIKINHRKVLDGMFAVCGVPSDKTRPISSAVDKLDKLPWVEVKKEMVEEKGLPEDVADRIGEYVQHSGGLAQVVELLRADAKLQANADVKAGVDDMALLTTYTDALGVSDRISFDLSLARGLDYYTGVIYEVILTRPAQSKTAKDDEVHVGSIAAGGRYDGLVGMYGKKTIPCVGVSFGVDRMFGLLEARQAAAAGGRRRESPVDVYVMAAGGGKAFDGLLPERMRVARELWAAGIRADFQAKVKAKLLQQFKAAGDTPVGVILGQDELARGEVRLRLLNRGGNEGEARDEGRLVKRAELVSEITKMLAGAAPGV